MTFKFENGQVVNGWADNSISTQREEFLSVTVTSY